MTVLWLDAARTGGPDVVDFGGGEAHVAPAEGKVVGVRCAALQHLLRVVRRPLCPTPSSGLSRRDAAGTGFMVKSRV
eukprot:3130952-Rhodomonas_salina.1